MAKTPEDDQPYRGADRGPLSESARRLSAAFGAAPFAGTGDIGSMAARAGQVNREQPVSTPPLSAHELHTYIQRPPLKKTIRGRNPRTGNC